MDLSLFTSFTNSLAAQEAQINQLQQQISTGLAVQTPDQNPAAYETGVLGTNMVNQLNNDNTTQAQVQTQLGSVSSAYTSMSTLFDNVQSIVEQALNGTTSAANMNALAGQVKSASQQLLSIGNTTASNGTYLFGGSRGGLTPFQANANGDIVYFGDGGNSQATIAPGQTASTIANGDVFVSSLSGDGISNVTASTSNTGSGQILQQGVVNAATANAFQQGSSAITVSFGTGNTYTATQGGSTIASGTLSTSSSGTSLQLAGVDYQITGSPANGDSFTISPARPQSAFALLQNVYNALANANSTPSQVAQTNQILNQSLAGLAQYQQATLTAQAQNGVTLQAISAASTSNTGQATEAQTNVDNATAVNTPVAIASLTQTMTALQAAMKTFGTVQSLSLFNYL
ncbi:flagellar hook-associated protein FlgL [Acidocella aromatica]|uniref:Flagellar hook-associated protein 3 FlgL n=1 Tax=Acidocella aromatica TaxID=1303579 RepID=A0A840VDH6_9PROT|nr:flagellar hook-associated protein FlgL [Acidocella aromatica]MBB5373756.1 flagellar hook-associated protein 3 FlgL [Acidocella aromatica]